MILIGNIASRQETPDSWGPPSPGDPATLLQSLSGQIRRRNHRVEELRGLGSSHRGGGRYRYEGFWRRGCGDKGTD